MATGTFGTGVKVPTRNVIRLIAETTIPSDWVIVKVDIERAGFDLVPCLAPFQQASLEIDCSWKAHLVLH